MNASQLTGRRWVIGDIHGANRALEQCLERACFDNQHDMLICLGDLCDRWPEVNKVFDTLLQVNNLVLLLGNHDEWALDWFLHGKLPDIWLQQGGEQTLDSYPDGVPEKHVNLLRNARLFFEFEKRLFVHAGLDPTKDITVQSRHTLLWDRAFVRSALHLHRDNEKHRLTRYEEVYIGHTPTLNFGQKEPIKTCEVYLMDTGAGWLGGVLSMMDIDSKELYQSEPVNKLYYHK